MLKYNGNVIKLSGSWANYVLPYTPTLPAKTMRFEFSGSMEDPTGFGWKSGSVWTRVSSSPNVWDYYRNSDDWGYEFVLINDVYIPLSGFKILEANLSGVTNMSGACVATYLSSDQFFLKCTSIENVYAPDIIYMSYAFAYEGWYNYGPSSLRSISFAPGSFSNGRNINCEGMCCGRQSLQTVPMFDTTHVINVNNMFRKCEYVESGSLALYEQMANQTNVPPDHDKCFDDCGTSTTSGRAEYDQIPRSWGGNLS